MLHSDQHRELVSILRQTTAREMPVTLRQLLLARKALAENNAPEARGLLEVAQTSIVFGAVHVTSEHAGIAVAQITEALSMLNSGDPVRALPYLNRAITAMQPSL
jgi:hypothetical protein